MNTYIVKRNARGTYDILRNGKTLVEGGFFSKHAALAVAEWWRTNDANFPQEHNS